MNAMEERIKELNKDLEDAENAYYSIKGELDNAKARIKELEEQLARSNMYALINQLHKIIWKNEERIKELEDKNRKLRYERLMWKARWWNDNLTGGIYGFWHKSKSKKVFKKYNSQWFRISTELEFRANKFKGSK